MKQIATIKMRLILILLMVIPMVHSVVGQTIQINNLTNTYEVQVIENMDTLNKNFLFDKTLQWVTINYASSKDMIQLADKERSKIVLKGNFPIELLMKDGWIEHTLTIDFKDGKIRYTYSGFSYYSSGSSKIAFESNFLIFKKKIFLETEQDIKNSIASLNSYILQNGSQKDEW